MGRKKDAKETTKSKEAEATIKVNETVHLAPHPPATEVRVTGPETDFVVRSNMGTVIHTYGSYDVDLGGGIDWSFSEPGEYTVRHMDSAGVEYEVEVVTVK